MKKSIRIFLLFTLTATFFSCTWQVPQSVSIKTAATYNFSVGEVKKDFSNYFSTESIMSSNFSDNPLTRLYDYFPGKTGSQCQKYLMKIPVQDIAVDFTQYFNETQLAENITDLSFDKRVTVPSINLALDQAIDTTALATALNALVTGSGTSTITFADTFTSIKYSSGKMLVTCSSPVSGSVTLKSGTRTVASGSISGGSAQIDLSGKTIEKSGMKLELPSGAGTFAVSIASNSVINEATGIKLSTPVTIPVNAQINTGSASDFNECVVGTGNLNVKIELPTGWTNTTVIYGVNLSGSLTASAPSGAGVSKNINLKDKTITPGTTNVSSSVQFTFANSNLKFNTPLKFTASANISNYKSITMTLSGVTTSLNQVENISTEMKQTVEHLLLDKSGLKGTYINTFPAGNNIGLTGNSSFIGLSNKSTTLNSGVSSSTNFSLKSDATKTVKFRETPAAADEYDRMDFTVNIALPGATSANPNRIKVVNVVPQTEYQIKIDIEPDICWKEIALYSTGTQQQSTRSTGLNVSQMFQAFSQAMGAGFDGHTTLKKLPVYIYSVRPNMACFEHAEFVGDLSMYYGVPQASGGVQKKTEYGEEVFLDHNNPAKTTMPFVDQPVIQREDGIVVTDITHFTPSQQGDLSSICNAAKDDTQGCLYVDYNLTFQNSGVSGYGTTGNTFTISYTEYAASGSSASSIAIFAYVEFPLDYLLDADVPINLFNMIGGGGTDLLGRSGPSSGDEKANFLNSIRSTKLNYTSTQLPFYGIPTANIVFDLDGTASDMFEVQSLSMSGGTLTICDYGSMVEVYPLVPSVQIVLKQGEFTIPRKVMLASKMNLSIEMDSNSSIKVWGGKK